jgi:hypothetical protein
VHFSWCRFKSVSTALNPTVKISAHWNTVFSECRYCVFATVLMAIQRRRHPEVLAVFGEPRRISHKLLGPSFETPRKRAAPQDDGWMCGPENVFWRAV